MEQNGGLGDDPIADPFFWAIVGPIYPMCSGAFANSFREGKSTTQRKVSFVSTWKIYPIEFLSTRGGASQQFS